MNLRQEVSIVIFGETLFDIFPDGTRVLGGAPFNVAWNLKGLGLEPLFISRLGGDEPGRQAFSAMRRFGLDTRGVQVDKEHPTGVVEIKMSGQEHSFDIKPDQAYDFIDGQQAVADLESAVPSMLYHGTLAPLFISRLGGDEPGRQVFSAMRRFGLDTRGVQVDKEHPTGVVEIKMSGQEHSFDIKPDQAYDFIDGQQAVADLESAVPSMLYHGTLALRSPESEKALNIIQRSSGAPVFVDVNLRAPWSDGALALEVMKSARWVKLNDNEFYDIAGGCSFKGENLEATADYLREETGLELLIITLGAQGAVFVTDGKIMRKQPTPVGKLVDTVGAGDALSAVTVMGLALGWPLETTMTRALEFASGVCAIRGATTENVEFYSSFVDKWRDPS